MTQTITATTIGFGAPSFEWSINGKPLFDTKQSGDTVTSPVDVPDPQHPRQPQHDTQILTFDYQRNTVTNAAGTSSSLTITTTSFGGDYNIEISVDCDEIVAPSTAVTAKQGLTFSTRGVVYGGSYTDDQQRCEKAFTKAIPSQARVYQTTLSVLKNLPDPPPGYLTTVLEAGETIREEIAQVAVDNPSLAAQMAYYASLQVGVPERVFLKGARVGAGT